MLTAVLCRAAGGSGRAAWSAALIGVLWVGAAPPSQAFVRTLLETGGKADPVRWPDALLPIPFELNDRSLNLLPNLTRSSAPMAAVQAALQLWSVAPVGLYLDGTTSMADIRSDGVNLITFADTASNRSLIGTDPWRTYTWETRQGNQSVIVEGDIGFHAKAMFSTDGAAGTLDVQAILAHELGHVLGLSDSPIPTSVMYPLSPYRPLSGRRLAPDDLAGLHAIYGGADPALGTITGRVLARDDSPIFGAAVVAVDQNGIVQVGALTDRDGSFVIPSLPASDYQLYAEPLDGPMLVDDLDGTYHHNSHHPVQTAFRTTFAGGNDTPAGIHVGTGATVSADPIRVEAVKPALNPLFLAWSPNGTTFHGAVEEPLQIHAGETRFLAVAGAGLTGAPRSGFTASGGDITFDPSRAVRGTTNGSLPYVIVPVTVRPDAKPGARSLYVASSAERAAFTAAIEVIAP